MRHRVLVVLPFLMFSIISPGQQTGRPETRFTSPASSAYVRQSDGAYVTDNKVFQFADVLEDDGASYTGLLLLKTTHGELIDGREGTIGRIRVQAWTIAQDGSRKRRWQFETAGNEGEALYGDRFYRVAQWGCCDWPPVKTYFSLLSGSRLYVSNSNLLSVSASEGGPRATRYVAFGYFDHGRPPLLQYGTDTKVTQQFSVLSPHEYYEPPQVLLMNGDQVFLKDGEARDSVVLNQPYAFTVVLRYPDGAEMRVPVQNDAIRPDAAVLPQGYSLRPARVDNW